MESLLEDHHQAMSGQSLEDVIAGSKAQSDQKKLMRPQPEQALKCPRCDSTNTKFCYYNNYSLSQPRYFCKGCRRYWTQGGSLRNVPVGGGCRKNRRSSSTSSSSSSSSKKSQEAHNVGLPITTCNGQLIPHLSSLPYDPSDLSLAFARLHRQQQQHTMGIDHDHHHPLSLLRSSSNTDHHHHGPAFAASGLLDALRTGFYDDPNTFNSGFNHNNEGGSVFPFGEMGSTGIPPFTTAAATTATTASSTITTATKQHQQTPYSNSTTRSFRDGEHQMEMWGMNWQFNGEGSIGNENPERDYWHGNGPAWHGLINSPLV